MTFSDKINKRQLVITRWNIKKGKVKVIFRRFITRDNRRFVFMGIEHVLKVKIRGVDGEAAATGGEAVHNVMMMKGKYSIYV